jgi:hypothetical protein
LSDRALLAPSVLQREIGAAHQFIGRAGAGAGQSQSRGCGDIDGLRVDAQATQAARLDTIFRSRAP